MASNFLLVAQREYLTRVRKRAFVVLTLLVPLLIAGFGAAVAYLAISDTTVETVDVLDDSGQRLAARLASTPTLQFHVVPGGTLADAKRGFQQAKHEGLLYLPAGFDVEQPINSQFFGKGNISLKRQLAVESALNKVLSEVKMQKSGLSPEQLERLRSRVDLQAISLDETGKEASSNAMATSGIAYGLAILIYFF
ncbi:MAG: ABC transporter permease, partial [Hymenobacter sp.]